MELVILETSFKGLLSVRGSEREQKRALQGEEKNMFSTWKKTLKAPPSQN